MVIFNKLQTSWASIQLTWKVRGNPKPLLDANRQTVISWAAKSACTRVLVWYYERLGLLEEALDHHRWPHKYRTEVLYRSKNYLSARTQLVTDGAPSWDYVKVVRDPVKRCVSSYRHALRHGYEDEKMSRVLRQRINHQSGFSYAIFLEYLSRINLNRCNPHHRAQTHPLDAVAFGRTWLLHIDEQDFEKSLADLNAAHGLSSVSRSRESAAYISHDSRRYATGEREKETASIDQWRQPLRKADINSWPRQALEKAPEAAALVREMYSCDYRMISDLKDRQ